MPVARTSDGVDLHYEVTGRGPRHVLFLHGWGGAGSGHSWRQLLPHLPPDACRAILVDFRGHGRSRPADGAFTIARMGEDALAAADAAGAARFSLAGFSMGGKVAQWIASHRPERVEAQFLMAPLALGEMPLTETLLQMWLRMAREQERFAEVLGMMETPPVSAEIMRGFFHDVKRAGEEVLSESFRMCARDAGAAGLGRTRARTLVIGGNYDNLMRTGLLRDRVAALIPGCRTLSIDAGHQMALTRGRELARLLAEFLAEPEG